MGEINLLGKMCKFLLARGWNFSLKVKLHRMIKFGLFAISLLFIVQVVNSPPEDKAHCLSSVLSDRQSVYPLLFIAIVHCGFCLLTDMIGQTNYLVLTAVSINIVGISVRQVRG